jgi:hypothetical protein
VKKEDNNHVQIVSAEISSESMTGMVIFRPHCVPRPNRNPVQPAKAGQWYALPPNEVRSFARALLDAADEVERKSRALIGAKTIA